MVEALKPELVSLKSIWESKRLFGRTKGCLGARKAVSEGLIAVLERWKAAKKSEKATFLSTGLVSNERTAGF